MRPWHLALSAALLVFAAILSSDAAKTPFVSTLLFIVAVVAVTAILIATAHAIGEKL